ncbi:hypothetical protein B0A58_05855 [Flavobacterium branchiophilum NBRC 15030 = ATCC 35035]|uniref:GLPGLI family protein n=1 Tax=Flavobacterium branchiophilum TaxID=55197 RepID=A0A543G0W6_9FLAO|nr:GLPGLI family protein [Flavobacterium branchiophilum]OXA77189.1 hypothetical protein B0A58_05855 [Flavobacterium branchiophilum NBRC 15030 = ATCC 35035]TQM39634.1 GLPGLI family protein [Flavobacterium branchiophilum]GEM56727.1 hypothetical protein FB1_29480 [Flavobacterium branchiophilum NBRC 15030 = ATCC 35035]
MKNLFIKIIFILFSVFSFAQKDKGKVEVEYKLEINNAYITRKGILNCNESSSLFKLFSTGDKEEKKEIDYETNSIKITERSIDEYNYIDITNDSIKSILNIKKDDYIIVEEIPLMQWILSENSEVKKINNFICNKAILNFRGRNYVAWFTTEIPISFGPWKFHGLPGLILEISDDAGYRHWVATKIKYPSNNKLKIEVFQTINAEKVTLKKFVEKFDNQQKSMFARINKIMPRGTISSSENSKRHTIEQVYEWEVEKK